MTGIELRRGQASRLEEAKVEFSALLLKCLQECARGRSGIFGQFERQYGVEKAKQYFKWSEADKLLALTTEIAVLREALHDETDFPAFDKFRYLRTLSGPGVPSEPKMALQFLQELKREELEARMPGRDKFLRGEVS